MLILTKFNCLLQITEIILGGACQNSGLQLEDEITHINSLPLAGKAINEVTTIIKQQVTKFSDITLTVKRGLAA